VIARLQRMKATVFGMAPPITLYHRGMVMTTPGNTVDGRTRNGGRPAVEMEPMSA